MDSIGKVAEGKIYGFSDEGFLFTTKTYGYFFDVKGKCALNGQITYTAMTGLATLDDMKTYLNVSNIDFSRKFDATHVFDCQRSPSYPAKGQSFCASGLSLPHIGGKQSPLKDCYSKLSYSYDDSITRLYLFHNNGKPVLNNDGKVAEGKIYGFSDEGFLFVSKWYGYFFDVKGKCALNGQITYTAMTGLATLDDMKTYLNRSTI